MTSLGQGDHHWRGIGDPRRSIKKQKYAHVQR